MYSKSKVTQVCIIHFVFLQLLVPLLVGVGVVVVTIVVGKIFFGGKKKSKGPKVTLENPEVKYPLELVDKEVRNLACYNLFATFKYYCLCVNICGDYSYGQVFVQETVA